MLFPIAEKFLSSARLSPYIQVTKGNEPASLDLYLDNLRIAQSFYAPLSLLEVAFRNALHDALTVNFETTDWLLTQQTGFMIDPSLTYMDQKRGKRITNDKVLKMVQAAINEFRQQRNHPPINGTALIAELPFGFWTTLFSRTYYFLLNKVPLRVFAQRPRGTTWETIGSKLTEIRTFRNRVYHYEPLCFQKQSNSVLCFSQLSRVHADIIALLSWIEPSLSVWLTEADRFPDVLKKLHRKHPTAT